MTDPENPLIAAMKKRNLTRGELARELEVSRVTAWRWEKGTRAPDRRYWAQLTKLVGIPLKVLAGMRGAAK